MSFDANNPKPPCPFPGIRPYRSDECDYFFGRENHVSQVFNLLTRHRFAAILGTSGAGKSSLINAGLIPLVENMQRAGPGLVNCRHVAEEPEESLQIIRMTPGDGPLRRFAKGLCSGSGHHTKGGQCSECTEWETAIRRGHTHTQARLAEYFDTRHGQLLIIVDQFEELFHWLRRESEAHPELMDRLASDAQIFVHQVLALRCLSGLLIVIGMRSDYLKDCSAYPNLAAAIAESLFIIPSLKWEELRQAITAPLLLPDIADQIDSQPSEGEVTRLLNQLSSARLNEADALPLMQDFLSKVWHAAKARDKMESNEKAQFSTLLRDLVSSDVLEVNDRLLENSLDDRGAELSAHAGVLGSSLRLFFAALLRLDSDGRVVRNPMRKSQLVERTGLEVAELDRMLSVFSADPPAWLTMSSALDPLIDIAHEALLRHWRLFSNPTGLPLQKSPGSDLTEKGFELATQLRISRRTLVTELMTLQNGGKCLHHVRSNEADSDGTAEEMHSAADDRIRIWKSLFAAKADVNAEISRSDRTKVGEYLCPEHVGLVPLANALLRAQDEALSAADRLTLAPVSNRRPNESEKHQLMNIFRWTNDLVFGIQPLLTEMRAELLRPVIETKAGSPQPLEKVLLGIGRGGDENSRHHSLVGVICEHLRRKRIAMIRRRLGYTMLVCAIGSVPLFFSKLEVDRARAHLLVNKAVAEKEVAEANFLTGKAEKKLLENKQLEQDARAKAEKEAAEKKLALASSMAGADFRFQQELAASFVEQQLLVRHPRVLNEALRGKGRELIAGMNYTEIRPSTGERTTLAQPIDRLAFVEHPETRDAILIAGTSIEALNNLSNANSIRPNSTDPKTQPIFRRLTASDGTSVSVLEGASFLGRTRLMTSGFDPNRPSAYSDCAIVCARDRRRLAVLSDFSASHDSKSWSIPEGSWIEIPNGGTLSDASIGLIVTENNEYQYVLTAVDSVGSQWSFISTNQSDWRASKGAPSTFDSSEKVLDVVELGTVTVVLTSGPQASRLWWRQTGSSEPWIRLEMLPEGIKGVFKLVPDRLHKRILIAAENCFVCVKWTPEPQLEFFSKPDELTKQDKLMPNGWRPVAAFTSDGKCLACSYKSEIRLFDLVSIPHGAKLDFINPAANSFPIFSIPLIDFYRGGSGVDGPTITALSFSPASSEQQVLAAGRSDGSVQIVQNWNFRILGNNFRNPFVSVWPNRKTRGVSSLTFSSNNMLIAGYMDGSLKVIPLTVSVAGKFSNFEEVRTSDGRLALYPANEVDRLKELGLVKRIRNRDRPSDDLDFSKMFVAAPWNYDYTDRGLLRKTRVRVRKAGDSEGAPVFAWPIDHCGKKDRPFVLSKGIIDKLGLKKDDSVVLEFEAYPRYTPASASE